jgi:hypothetical protein
MKAALVVVVALVLVAATAPVAEARHCRIGNSGITMNLPGDIARFSQLHAMRGMNCASARYAINRLRRAFRRSQSSRLPRRFHDGYVTWHCGRRSRFRWQCNEFTSNTAFRFRAVIDPFARRFFRSPDRRVICLIARFGTAPPEATCQSRSTLRRRPEAPRIELCGSGMSVAVIRPRGRTVLHETCNPLWLPGSPGPRPRTLRPGQRVTTRQFRCRAVSRRTIRCASRRSGRGFKVSRTTFRRF